MGDSYMSFHRETPWGSEAGVDFPLAGPRHCAFCGSEAWVAAYPILRISAQRAEADLALPWVFVGCARCDDLVRAEAWQQLVAVCAEGEADGERAPAVIRHFREWRTEPFHISRSEAESRSDHLSAES